VDPKQTPDCSPTDLLQELSDYKRTPSRFFPDVDLEHLFSKDSKCRVVKLNNRRRIYFLQAAGKGYYLKLSTLTRTKDRLRHLLLPARRWAEWRNLHRLLRADVPVALPVMKGGKSGLPGGAFFIVTARVDGTVPKYAAPEAAQKLGRFVARLHSRGIYHADLNPHNILLRSDNKLCLIDVQEVYFWPRLPRRLRIYNLGRLAYHLGKHSRTGEHCDALLRGYNSEAGKPVASSELSMAAQRYARRHYRSRSKRCCKNSSEFEILKGLELHGYRRRDFLWAASQIVRARQQSAVVKPDRVYRYESVCIKPFRRKILHRDRCLTSWKMSQALAVRGIMAPRALGYYKIGKDSLFLSEFLADGKQLNDYLSGISEAKQKRPAIKQLAAWIVRVHSQHIWQRDFKSSNVLVHDGNFYMLDLEGVKIRRLSRENRIVNLAQLNASLSNAVTVKDRLRFFNAYTAGENMLRHQRRAMIEKIWEISEAKTTTYYDLDLSKLRRSFQKPQIPPHKES
jgi:tRNA A-37 threonylcarbamoyl transferase component Bud32